MKKLEHPGPTKKRILMLNSEFPPMGGGVGRMNELLLNCLKKAPLAIDVVTSGYAACETQHSPDVRLIFVGSKLSASNSFSNQELLRYFRIALPKILRLQKEQPYDLCIAWNSVPCGFLAMLLKGFYGVPYIVSLCGSDVPGHMKRYRWLYPFLRPLLSIIWRHAEGVICKSAYEVRRIRSLQPKAKILLIPNGIDLPAETRPVKHDSDPSLDILCVGRLMEHKGQHHLIAAIARLSNAFPTIRLHLAGAGPEERNFRILAQQLGIADHVLFYGQVQRTKLPSLYRSCDIFVLASYNEGMSVSILEALSYGLPVISTTSGGAEELIAEGENGFTFTWGDINTLTGLLAKLLRDRALRTAMGTRSKERAACFSIERMADSYLNILCSDTHE